MVQQLDICQRALSDFLEEKRSIFPRFYFIGDDDLLEVRGRSCVLAITMRTGVKQGGVLCLFISALGISGGH